MKRLYAFTITLFCLLSMTTSSCASHKTALDTYIAQPDSTYNYQVTNSQPYPGFTVVTIEMDSVSWRSPEEVDRTIWQHQLITIVPNTLTHNNGLMWISGGNNQTPSDEPYDPILRDIALMTQSLVTEVRMIPNQRIKFSDEEDSRYQEKGRKEDELIAYGWDKYLNTLDPLWLPRLPMTKAVIRAMDTIQAEYSQIQGFAVAGTSKRGWTAWTTAAVDPRVIALAPLSIDVPNVIKNMQHHYDVYGNWSEALEDYEDLGVMEKLHSKEFKKMMKVIDPYYYFKRLKMPKYIINATGDEFFLPDSSQFYFGSLKKQKYLRYVPNADHDLNNEAVKDFLTFYYSVLNDKQRPQYRWKKLPDGTLKVITRTPPESVKLWQATNPLERNFRLDNIGPAWKSSELLPVKEGIYIAKPETPDQGWTAFMIELEYNIEAPFPLRVTSEVSIIPDK